MISASLVKELREMTGAGMMDCKKALVETNGDLDAAVTWLREKGISKAAKKASRIAAEGVCAYQVDGNKAVMYEVNSETDFVAKNESFLKMVENIGKAILASKESDPMKAVFEGTTVEEIIIQATATIGEKISLRRVTFFDKTDSQTFGYYSHMNGKIATLVIIEGNDFEVAKNVAMHIAAMNPKYLDDTKINAEDLEKEKNILTQEALNDPQYQGKPANVIENIVKGRISKYLKEICLVDQIFVKAADKQTVGEYVKSNRSSIISFIRLEVGEGIEKKQDDFVAEVMSQL
ncbi:MAG: translation elongation factor Ts [Bacilli bacterium]|nr:translation elongation factor Ts [Bacilli bacterium]